MKQVIVLVGTIILGLVLFSGVVGVGEIGEDAAEAGFSAVNDKTTSSGEMYIPRVSLDPGDYGIE